jgi:multimeric flavodoxin WrbA
MQYLLYNGSPRGKNGNTELIINKLIEGLSESTDDSTEVIRLNQPSSREQGAQKIASADCAILVFPLYTDAMPGIVMDFIEKLEPYKASLSQLSLGFVVHSGFPEGKQSRAVEKYLARLVTLLGAKYAGTVVAAGSMGMSAKRQKIIRDLGHRFPETMAFDPILLPRASGFEKLPKAMIPVMSLLSKSSLMQFYWNSELKKNGAFADRDARPYAKTPD